MHRRQVGKDIDVCIVMWSFINQVLAAPNLYIIFFSLFVFINASITESVYSADSRSLMCFCYVYVYISICMYACCVELCGCLEVQWMGPLKL